MIDTQLGRRNLTPVQKIAIAEKYRESIQKEARENYINNVGRPTTEENLLSNGIKIDNIVHVRKELAKIAKVGSGTIARRLERIEKIKAEERSGARTDLMENFPTGCEGQVRDIVAEKIGIGSGRNYDRAKFISENATEDMIKSLDDGKLSINAAYKQLKEEKEMPLSKIDNGTT